VQKDDNNTFLLTFAADFMDFMSNWYEKTINDDGFDGWNDCPGQ
jgi:hypothetical protein